MKLFTAKRMGLNRCTNFPLTTFHGHAAQPEQHQRTKAIAPNAVLRFCRLFRWSFTFCIRVRRPAFQLWWGRRFCLGSWLVGWMLGRRALWKPLGGGRRWADAKNLCIADFALAIVGSSNLCQNLQNGKLESLVGQKRQINWVSFTLSPILFISSLPPPSHFTFANANGTTTTVHCVICGQIPKQELLLAQCRHRQLDSGVCVGGNGLVFAPLPWPKCRIAFPQGSCPSRLAKAHRPNNNILPATCSHTQI